MARWTAGERCRALRIVKPELCFDRMSITFITIPGLFISIENVRNESSLRTERSIGSWLYNYTDMMRHQIIIG